MPTVPQVLRELFAEAVAACEAGALVRTRLTVADDELRVGEVAVPLPAEGQVTVVAAGKAAAAMARAAEELLGSRCAGGVAVTKDGHARPTRLVEVLEAAHPVPDARGVEAAQVMTAALASLTEDDLALVLLSGGASALLPLPVPELTLSAIQEATAALLAGGAPITEVNTVRRHLTAVGGGGLLSTTRARLLVLLVSDVMGDELCAIGSGPCAADPTTYDDALAVIAKRGVAVPESVRRYLEEGARGDHPETVKPGDPRLERVDHVILGSFATLQQAAVAAATRRGIAAEPMMPRGDDVNAVAAAYAPRARRPGPALLVGGGEPVVTLPNDHGRGGRNQQLALLLARAMAGTTATFLAGGSDGTDGPTDAAGAVVDGGTWEAAERLGLAPQDALDRYRAFPVHEALGTTLRTGPTGTNVLDLHLLAPPGSLG